MKNRQIIKGLVAFGVMLLMGLIAFGCAVSQELVGKRIVLLSRPTDTVQIIGCLSDRFEVRYVRRNGTSYSYMIDRKELFVIVK
jgi:hypothetical protein